MEEPPIKIYSFLLIGFLFWSSISSAESPIVPEEPKISQEEKKGQSVDLDKVGTSKNTRAPLTEKKSKKEKSPVPVPAFELVLPTENREIFGDPSRFYMHTNRYVKGINTRPWQGGKYGFVRNKRSTQIGVVYTRLHEGIDIRPVRRDKRNVPLDDVRTMSDGTVAYVNSSSSRSNYGKYVVVRHDWPDGSFYSLYAHLASTVVKTGEELEAGAVLGRLGYTGDGIDRERAHVHVELAFLLSERFNTDYSSGSSHKNFNGINLIGIDVARFLKEYQENPYLTVREFLADEDPYFKVITRCKKKPGILERHPWLGKDMGKADDASGWEFTFAQSGVPLAISPSETKVKYPVVTWVKTVNTNHSYMTMGRLVGSGSKAKLSSRGHRFIKLISEAF